MKSSVLPVLASGLLLAGTSQAAAVERGPSPKVVALPITAVSEPSSVIAKRDKTATMSIDNKKLYYMTDIKIGTPPQKLTVQIDTGSSDLWANVPSSKFCKNASDPCSDGTFDAGKSSSYKFKNNGFDITYVDGSGASGAYGTDKIEFGSIKLDNFQFGLGNNSHSNRNLFGIGYEQGEALSTKKSQEASPYDNFPAALVKAKIINSKTYSLWLDDLDARKGQLLFGGINKAKFEGTLQKVPITSYNNTGQYTALQLPLTEIKVDGSSALSSPSKEKPLNTLLDSGSSLTVLPNSMAKDIFKKLDAKYHDQWGVATIDCKQKTKEHHMSFTFNGNVTVEVSMDQLILPFNDVLKEMTSALARRDDYAEECVVGITPLSSTSESNSNSTGLLGDTFLRSVYAVYDLDNNEISLAKANINPGEDDIEEIPAGKEGVPTATGAPSESSTSAANSGPSMLSHAFLINILGMLAFSI